MYELHKYMIDYVYAVSANRYPQNPTHCFMALGKCQSFFLKYPFKQYLLNLSFRARKMLVPFLCIAHK